MLSCDGQADVEAGVSESRAWRGEPYVLTAQACECGDFVSVSDDGLSSVPRGPLTH